MAYEEQTEELTYREVDEIVERELLATPRFKYIAGLMLTGSLLLFFFGAWLIQIREGIGMAGMNHPVGWTTYIVTFVFWVGIAHSGTLISAVLYLLRAQWRTSIYRAAEAMTVFAVMTAGIFPLVHLGRVWRMYYILPYPNQRELWPNFSSPLLLDVIAVNTYLTVSGMFFFLGLIPDLATIRDRSTGLKRKIYGILSLGWVGTYEQWRHYRWAYTFFAALATPLVFSVHSVVSWDFALSIVPGWHATILAPYFVAGAIHSGLAMVLTLLIPMRMFMGFGKLIKLRDFEMVCKALILTGGIVGYSYLTEIFVAWYSGNIFEQDQFIYRITGHYAVAFWTMFTCNVIVPLFFLFKRLRTNLWVIFILSILINVGMWFERYVIIVISLSHEYIPYSWDTAEMFLTDSMIMVGSFGLFGTLFLIFTKVLPPIATTELKEAILMEKHDEYSGGKG